MQNLGGGGGGGQTKCIMGNLKIENRIVNKQRRQQLKTCQLVHLLNNTDNNSNLCPFGDKSYLS